MREIKFRAWLRGKMTYGAVQWTPAENGEWLIPLEDGNLVTKDADIMQFTGLHDKNGKEIYEGDILASPQRPHNPHVVSFRDGCFDILLATGSYQHLCDAVSGYEEVIGNVHEHPELQGQKARDT